MGWYSLFQYCKSAHRTVTQTQKTQDQRRLPTEVYSWQSTYMCFAKNKLQLIVDPNQLAHLSVLVHSLCCRAKCYFTFKASSAVLEINNVAVTVSCTWYMQGKVCQTWLWFYSTFFKNLCSLEQSWSCTPTRQQNKVFMNIIAAETVKLVIIRRWVICWAAPECAGQKCNFCHFCSKLKSV